MTNMYEESREIIEPYNLPYPDLISLSSSSSSSSLSSSDENRRLEVISTALMEALGPTGPGLLAITDVPNAVVLRNTLLPLARDLALLPSDLRNRILMAHGLGSDVPLKNLDRCVSSFATQLKYGDGLVPSKPTSVSSGIPVKDDGFSEKLNHHFKDLSGSFRELGLCMMDMGLRVARVCDKAIGGREIEKSLLESGTAKGRLIHYHSSLDTHMIKEYAAKRGSRKRQPKLKNVILLNSKDMQSSKTSELSQLKGGAGRACEKVSELWQQWHYDYGTFTVLASPMFTRPKLRQDEDEEDGSMNFRGLECPSPSGHTYLQIIHPNKDNICIVKVPPESFILQVGESANILSRNKLQSTLHSVLRPVELESLSRETFVVFLHPAWNKAFDLSEYPTEELASNCHQKQNFGGNKDGVKKLKEEIHKIIPPLSSRLKDGMTFAEFSRQTTKQYYGGNGFQANR
ncbi:uncharacterized protein LOC141652542 [Silene latifolia]|uniref:uncharacterized protein LOC141652542 n=1 Tax=Silene latifolia TaxID=37657 RepID=UPI003D781A87